MTAEPTKGWAVQLEDRSIWLISVRPDKEDAERFVTDRFGKLMPGIRVVPVLITEVEHETE